MSVNAYKPHVLVLPEDDANSAMATGFELEIRQARNMQVLPAAGGWMNARDAVASQHAKDMRRFAGRHLVLLVDFDGDLGRGIAILGSVPDDLRDRVFVLGARTEPEALRAAGLGTFETIGQRIATACRDGSDLIARHELLNHNQDELARLRGAVASILF